MLSWQKQFRCWSAALPLTIDIEVRRLIVDTGSNVSILKPGVSSSDIKVTPLKRFGVTGETLDVKGRQTDFRARRKGV